MAKSITLTEHNCKTKLLLQKKCYMIYLILPSKAEEGWIKPDQCQVNSTWLDFLISVTLYKQIMYPFEPLASCNFRISLSLMAFWDFRLCSTWQIIVLKFHKFFRKVPQRKSCYEGTAKQPQNCCKANAMPPQNNYDFKNLEY